MKKSEWNLIGLWGTSRYANIYIMGVSEEAGEKEQIKIFKEIMAEDVPNFMKDVNINIQEAEKNSKEEELKAFHTQIVIT